MTLSAAAPVPRPSVISRRSALRFAVAMVPIGAGLALPGTARAALAPGSYRPSSSTTGPVPGTSLKRIDEDFVVSRNGQVIEKLDIYGRILLKHYTNVTVRNCIVRGSRATGKASTMISGDWYDNRGLVVEDCRLLGQGNIWVAGMTGCNYTIRRTEIANVLDGICLTMAAGNVTIEACWIHNGLYQEWAAGAANVPNASGNYTHNDGIQFHRGKNYTIRGNLIGGSKQVGLLSPHSGKASTINGADDYYNSAIMLKQEVDSSTANRIENVLIERNWLAGGVATLNIAAGRGNKFSSTTIRDNRFIRSTWGDQYYIYRAAGLANLSRNVFDDNGAAVPVVAA